jgi:hypothetical protein
LPGGVPARGPMVKPAFFSSLKMIYSVFFSTGWFLPNKALKGFVHYDSRWFDFLTPTVFTTQPQ